MHLNLEPIGASAPIVCLMALLVCLLATCAFSWAYALARQVAEGRGWRPQPRTCRHCHHQLPLRQQMPVVGCLACHGTCRVCGTHTDVRHMVVELAGPAAALLCIWGFGLSWRGLACFALMWLLLVIALVDLDTRIIPNRLVLAVLAVVLAGAFAGVPGRTAFDALVGAGMPDGSWTSRIIGAFCVSVPMLLLALPRGGFGGGDVKLMAAVGLLLGWQLTLLAFLVGITAAAVYALVLVCRHRAGRRTTFALGPFLAAGTGVSLFCGNGLVHLYLCALGLA